MKIRAKQKVVIEMEDFEFDMLMDVLSGASKVRSKNHPLLNSRAVTLHTELMAANRGGEDSGLSIVTIDFEEAERLVASRLAVHMKEAHDA